ncbi:MAG: DUF2723 domain-containing protein [Chitinophagaceae bacterium]|nr:DUF2723 domain-containing protein [Chitinophagaceae bacterium]
MTFKRLNNIVGWIVCLVACTVYVLTMEPTGSFWDCGEFVSSAFKLQIPHPPGAPLFTLLGRFFIVLFGDDPMSAARGVNFMSALASGFTILFLFWTITHFARKIVHLNGNGNELTNQQLISIMGAGVVGALAYTFSDSFWYSAVEGEVYALSSLFTAIVFWAILKWEHEVDQESKTDGHKFSRADRWIIFIFFMMGLSIGVHLLNLLTIPAIVMVYYFKRYTVSRWGALWAFLIGCVIVGIVQVAIIQWSINGAGAFDIFFVNKLGTPFFVGFAVYFILLFGLLILGLRFKENQVRKFSGFGVWLAAILLLFCFPFISSALSGFGLLVLIGAVVGLCYYFKERIYSFLKIAVLSTVFVIIGYSTYFTTLIRSSANPSVDMYNVDNPVSLVGYLSRDQYGDWPILYGPDFTYRPPTVAVGDLYVKGQDKYNVVGEKRKQDWGGKPNQGEVDQLLTQHPDWNANKIGPKLFPRMHDNGNERNQEYVYRVFGGLDAGEQPGYSNNIRYLLHYQTYWMYGRYFLWNFAGKQNDLQGFGNARDGNWASGISFIDNLFNISDTSVLPESAGKGNKANNKLFFLPLVFGILGFAYQLKKNKRDLLVSFLLFFCTGFAIVIYLNQAGFQPRERDYAYVGSFYAFAIWIGLGALWLKELFEKFIKGAGANYLALGISVLAVPVLMASQEWDDHDRSQKTLAYDLGKNYLESCEKDAIVISFGDNDTYPLWYTQEVAGNRRDLRVMNYSLLGTDWYINQLRYRVNESAPADVLFTPEQIEGTKREAVFGAAYLSRYNIPNNPVSLFDQNKYHDLYTILKTVTASDDPRYQVLAGDDEYLNTFPVSKVSVPVDVALVSRTMKFNPEDTVVSELKLDIKKSFLQKNDLAILALIAANKWQRPIYFTSTQELEELGLEKYTRAEGLSYRLVPVENKNPQGNIARDISYKVMMEKFAYGNANVPKTFFDEENRRHINSIRAAHAFLGLSLAYNDKKDSARKVLQRYDQMVLNSNVPYGMTSNRANQHNRVSMSFLLAAYESGDLGLAAKVSASVEKDLKEQMRYYRSLGDENMTEQELGNQAISYMNQRATLLNAKQEGFAQDIYSCAQFLGQITEWKQMFKAGNPATTTEPGAITIPAPDSGNKKP